MSLPDIIANVRSQQHWQTWQCNPLRLSSSLMESCNDGAIRVSKQKQLLALQFLHVASAHANDQHPVVSECSINLCGMPDNVFVYNMHCMP